MGMVTIMVVAARMDWVEIRDAWLFTASAPTVASCISSLILLDSMRMSRSSICSVSYLPEAL